MCPARRTRDRAARVYLHAREERDHQLAATLDKMARRELRRSSALEAAANPARSGHAGVPRGHKRRLAIMADKPLELGTRDVERVTGIETRTISLGIAQIMAVISADLAI